jgi:hypothetical protein
MDRGISKHPPESSVAGSGDLTAGAGVAASEHRCMTAAVGHGEPPEPARSEPINYPDKKQHHT